MENTEFNDNDAPPVEAAESGEHSQALSEAMAEEAAFEAQQAELFDQNGNLKPGAAFRATSGAPEPVSLSAMLGVGNSFVLGDKLCRLSALSLLETDVAQAVLNRAHPLLYAAVLTDPPKGSDNLSALDAPAIAQTAALVLGKDTYSVDEARAGLRKLTLRLPLEQQRDFAGIVLTSVRKWTPEVTDDEMLGAFSLAELIGATRQVFAISGGLADFFAGG